MADSMSYQLILGDCLQVMPTLPAGSVDCIICDLPYGVTACKWDTVIPFEPMWSAIKHVVKPKAAVVLFGSQPFTSALVMSNPKWFRYEWVWDKVNRYTGSLLANRQPLRRHENIVVFCGASLVYNKQYRQGPSFKAAVLRGHGGHTRFGSETRRVRNGNDGEHHNPCSVLSFKGKTAEQGLHPTQKPVALLEYLIRTYTNEGDTILDFCAGSASTGVAALNTGRRFIGIERDEAYYNVATERLEQAAAQLRLAV